MLPTVMDDVTKQEQGLGKVIYEALDNGLMIFVNIKNHRVTYSIINRPDPNLTPVSDHLLATALIEAGSKFRFERSASVGRSLSGPNRNDTVIRDDGTHGTYSSAIEISWEARVIESSMRKQRTLRVLSIVVQNLMASAMKAKTKASPHGAN